jgi:hypothetical protein
VTGKVRFGQQVQPGDTTRLRELMPHWLADDSEIEIGYDLFAQGAKGFDVAKEVRRTSFRVD